MLPGVLFATSQAGRRRPSGYAYAQTAHTAKGGTADSVTSDPADTTGATRIVLAVASLASVATPAVTDSKGNTWTLRALWTGVDVRVAIFECLAPTVGSGHTFTATQTGCYPAISVVADNSSGAFDSANGASGSNVSVQPGTYSPTYPGEAIFSAIGVDEASITEAIDSGFTITDQVAFSSGVHFGIALARLVQGAASPVNPTWTGGSSGLSVPTVIAGFRTVP